MKINYVPYDPRDEAHSIDSPREQVSSNTGARPKSNIDYVPHVPADLERLTDNSGRLERTEVIQLPSVVVTRPDSSQMDVVYSKTIDSKHFMQSESVSQSVSSVSKTSTSHIQSTIQEMSTTKSANDGEVEAYLREVTQAVDKISSIRDRVAAIPSYDEPVKQTEAIEQEVALMEPDVATVISRGDTLTLTTHMVDVPRANTIRIAVNDLRKHWTELKTTTENLQPAAPPMKRKLQQESTEDLQSKLKTRSLGRSSKPSRKTFKSLSCIDFCKAQ